MFKQVTCLNKYASNAIQRKKHYLIKAYSSIHYRETLKRAKLYCVKHNIVKAYRTKQYVTIALKQAETLYRAKALKVSQCHCKCFH